jgi:SIR2-like domain
VVDSDWQLLLRRISTGACTPFLGAGACEGTIPLASELATRWALEHGYPLEDAYDLARVAQYVGVHQDDAMYPKELVSSELLAVSPPDFTVDTEPHAVLAALPLPIYMTTNYDDFMAEALRCQGKQPRREICRWNASPAVRAEPSPLLDGHGVPPSPANPIVYHLHGHLDLPESLVLTEDDYLDFLVAVSRDQDLLPHQIQRALAGTSLLFVGYRLSDWDFRVIHRGLVMAGEQSLRRLSVTVQLPRTDPAQQYLDRYFGAMKVRVYWGSAGDFMLELRERWHAFSDG